jgi:CRP-like cAMP-binding protein
MRDERFDEKEGENTQMISTSGRTRLPEPLMTPTEMNGNKLIDGLGVQKQSVISQMKMISLEIKDVLYENNRPIRHIYFPVDGVASWVQPMRNGKSVEVATVGNEGFVGVPILLGTDRTQGTSFYQIAGRSLRIGVEDFRALLAETPNFARIL